MNHSFPRRSFYVGNAYVRHSKPETHALGFYRHYISASSRNDKILLKNLSAMKKRNEPITMITCYDASQAKLADSANIDTVLVGDSCANVMMGLQNTNQITMEAMIHHTQSVVRGVSRAYVIADMPYASYLTPDDAVRNAARLISEGGASCVKLEGFVPDSVQEISRFVPVCAHLGLLPQTADCFGTRGRTYRDIKQLAQQALKLQECGASLLVLEKVCAETAAYISSLLDIPTIGIGSGPHCNGQVLVWHDMLGLHLDSDTYKFVKRYTNLAPCIVSAITEYIGDVKGSTFPTPQHSYYLGDKTRDALIHDPEIWNDLEMSSDDFFKQIKEGCEYYCDVDDDEDQGTDHDPKRLKRFRQLLPSQRTQKYTKIIKSAAEIRNVRNEMEQNDNHRKSIIFVPFLGGLHEGHLALIQDAKQYESTHQIWCSLFLNPLQFNDVNDYIHYPYDMMHDIEALTKLGVDVIFTPSANDMYPYYDTQTNINNNGLFGAYVDYENISKDCDEGKQRPGHFKGVGTVLTKLFAWIRPQKAIFGQKDFMQCVVVKNLCTEFFPDIQIIVHKTEREEDGLAMSSRNRKLSTSERERAPLLYECLSTMACYLFDAMQKKDGEARTIHKVKQIGEQYAKSHGIELEYISFHDFNNGMKLEKLMDEDSDDLIAFMERNEMVISIAGSVGESTRLIDNVVIGGKNNNKILWEGIKRI